MEKFHRSQCAKIVLIALLLLVSPLLSNSKRPFYFFLLFNLLIIALGAESGVLTASKPPSEEKKPALTTVSAKPLDYREPMTTDVPRALEEESAEVVIASAATEGNVGVTVGVSQPPRADAVSAKAVRRSASEKAKQAPTMAVKIGQVMNKCPSMPSLFFIGSCDGDDEAAEEDKEEEVGVPTNQELYAKAETFIGNFYKQLKIQREDSWKRIHGLYHKAF